MFRSSAMASLLTVLVLAVVAVRITEAQQSCASQLVPCASYLNATTTPPASCCDPIKKAVAEDLPCLCRLYENPVILAQLRINITEALRLPTLCGIPSSTSACDNATAPTSSRTPPGNGVDKIASSGMFSLFLVWICMMFY